MSEINFQALREIAKQATQGKWVAFISPGKYGMYAVHTPDDNHHGDIVDWPGFDEQKNAENNARYIAAFNPEIVLALLDERERNQQYIKRRDQENEDIALTVGKLRVELEEAKSKLNEQREYYEGVISDGSKRIAELESGSQAQKLVEAIIVAIENEQERLFDEDYLMDSKECIDVIREEVKRWDDSRAAGIRIKGEEHGNKTRG
ncbi:ead/Ea22-like family protein [Escherichia coli]|uniref:ead/Ea22-like family protein n=1 Tax=Escherichia coli TaxID=562 RepID=UPI000530753E|nr:ead/Ea22-like family protein [Escherichia coli]EFH8351268.1 ead/Ea22-like family protein [Escherichia coli]EFH8882060.1 ead/Ea22-like family protein [Escherichia coli]EFO0957658.1 ead/Ea22-like family protein [Escherichia coli]EGG7850055.1 ead/Ea22-like family protein [Escherichia coli]EGG9439585.1 ead/Ea22-like family protein [Escherichia coli]